MTMPPPHAPAQTPPPAPRPVQAAAQALAQNLPALLAQAQLLAQALAPGAHGRARAGQGDEFWQFRPAMSGDSAAQIDWRRSAASDGLYVRQREWQAQNHVALWVDGAASMAYASDEGQVATTKAARAQVLALALAMLLLHGGERVGLVGGAPARTGRAHLAALARELAQPPAGGDEAASGAPPDRGRRAARAVYLSDFLGPLPATRAALQRAAAQGTRGLILQILDPAETSFPFSGRNLFLSMGGGQRYETQNAADLRPDYLRRLAQRQADLSALAGQYGWRYRLHVTDQPPIAALIWAAQHLGQAV